MRRTGPTDNSRWIGIGDELHGRREASNSDSGTEPASMDEQSIHGEIETSFDSLRYRTIGQDKSAIEAPVTNPL